MDDFEPSKDRIDLFKWLVPAFSRFVVACDYDPLRPDEHSTPFGLCREGVVVCPDLEVIGIYPVGAHLIDNDGVLVLVTTPPFVRSLDVGIRESLTDSTGLPRPRVTPMPFVLHDWDCFALMLEHGVELNRLVQLLELCNGDESFVNRLGGPVLQDHLVTGGSVSLDVLSGWRNAVIKGSFDLSVLLGAIVPGGKRVA